MTTASTPPLQSAAPAAPVPTAPRTRIKFCGLTRPGDVDAAVAAGADAVGFVLWPGSRRAVDCMQAAALAARLPPFVMPVLLFVNASPDERRRAFDAVPHALAQFHGDEAPADCAAGGRPWTRAVRMAPGIDLLDLARACQAHGAAGLVLDAHVEGYGGGGKAFDWSLVPACGVSLPVVLSGGLHAGNVAAGIAALRPFAVDVSSGIESAPGVKDAAAMRSFVAAVRSADAQRPVDTSESRPADATLG